jgi:hypothetical protein
MRRPIRRRTLRKATELALAAPQVVALRTLGALGAGDRPNAATRREWTRMRTEKSDAFTRSIAATSAQWLRYAFELPFVAAGQWWNLWVSAAFAFASGRPLRNRALERHWQRAAERAFDAALAPVHATAVANARRLQRGRRR